MKLPKPWRMADGSIIRWRIRERRKFMRIYLVHHLDPYSSDAAVVWSSVFLTLKQAKKAVEEDVNEIEIDNSEAPTKNFEWHDTTDECSLYYGEEEFIVIRGFIRWR